MLNKFSSRDQLIAYLREQFPKAAERSDRISDIVGGRKAAKQALQKVDPQPTQKPATF